MAALYDMPYIAKDILTIVHDETLMRCGVCG
jgi:hypothetical protein